ncbi:hypothetical protein V1477_002806, partial [Vespula maculifrons]
LENLIEHLSRRKEKESTKCSIHEKNSNLSLQKNSNPVSIMSGTYVTQHPPLKICQSRSQGARQENFTESNYKLSVIRSVKLFILTHAKVQHMLYPSIPKLDASPFRTLAYVTYEATTKSTTLRLKQFVIRECFFACGYVKNGKHHEGDRQKRLSSERDMFATEFEK